MTQNTQGRFGREPARPIMSRRAFVALTGAGALAIGGDAMPARAAQSTNTDSMERAANAAATPAARANAPAGKVRIFPANGARTAPPATEISLRGTTLDEIRPIVVHGSVSGLHSGLTKPHADGKGVSFLPDAPFEPGETVTVRANQPLGAAANGAAAFTVARPAAVAPPREIDPKEKPKAKFQSFRSRPDLKPPTIDITTAAHDTAPGLILLGAKISNGIGGPLILDDQGEVVWYTPVPDSWFVNDLRVQEWRGQPVLTWWEGATPTGYGQGHYVIADSSYRRIAEFRPGNGYDGGDVHEFLITTRDTALVTIYNPVAWDLTSMGGKKDAATLDGIAQEIEIETGRVLFEWHSLDHIDITESVSSPPSSADEQFDYMHINSIAEDEDGSLIISGRKTSTVYKIDHQTGEVLWRLNGKHSDFNVEARAIFALQHDARPHPGNRLSIFDNATDDPDAGIHSRGLILQLDMATMNATMVTEFVHETHIVATSQGNCQALPNGNWFIGWGNAPVFTEFSADGAMRFNGRLPVGANSYRAFRHEWSGLPNTPPAIAGERVDEQTARIYVSWNGATDVAAWRVLAGPASDQLQPVTDAARTGFETMILVETPESHLAAQALDAQGNAIGLSQAVAARSLG